MMRNLKSIHCLAMYPVMAGRVKSPVMAQAWFLSTCRHTVRGCGLLRTLQEDLA